MSNNDNTFYDKTPGVTIFDNLGLRVRELQYHRHPDSPEVTEECITRHQYDVRGFLTQSIDARLYVLMQTDDSVRPNFTYRYSLVGEVVHTESVDAGMTDAISDVAGRPFLAVTGIGRRANGAEERSQAVTRTFQYESADLPGRPLSITEQATGEAARITERFVYAGHAQAEKDQNLAGRCVRHYDTAGLVRTDAVALSGVPLSVTRQLLKDDAEADWQGADVSAWNDLLAAEAFTTQTVTDATGAVLTTTDAQGNVQRLAYNVAGLLSGSWLTLYGGKEQAVVKSLTYSAAGQKLREAHGNGVVTTYTYELQTQRLTGIKTERPAGHALGAKVLQDLRYQYDPVGNVLNIANDAEQTRFWRNQKVVPENSYVYDSLYQLVSASGREMAGIAQQDASLPSIVTPLASGDGAYTNYTRTYAYDSGGNLTQMRHGASASGNNYTTNITVSSRSNRAVLSTLTENPAEVDGLFTAGGQQKSLQPGQNLAWTPRGELLKVTPVARDGAADDSERYRYGAGSQRILKVSRQQSGNSARTQRVVYLPGLEQRTTSSGDAVREERHVITVGEAGRAQVRVLHWESGKPEAISNDMLRYSYDNLLGSCGLEVDGEGNIISEEEYYPYGGTAVWTARSAVEADYKTVCYSGKERDATGLYYYGYRYYQPWAGRWLSADPAGTIDGLNLYRMVRNNPVTFEDSEGLSPSKSEGLSPSKNKMKLPSLESPSGNSNSQTALMPEYDVSKEMMELIVSKRVYKIESKVMLQSDIMMQKLMNLRGSSVDLNPAKTSPGRETHHYPTARFPTPDQVQEAPLSTAPSQVWITETMDTPTWDTQYLFGANRQISGESLYEPLKMLARRPSLTRRAINILSGSHGTSLGLDWVMTERKTIIRDPDVIANDFHKEDLLMQKSIDIEKIDELKPLVNRVNVIDMEGMDAKTFRNYVRDPANHIILAYCFGRNDNLLRHVRNLKSVVSYVPG